MVNSAVWSQEDTALQSYGPTNVPVVGPSGGVIPGQYQKPENQYVTLQGLIGGMSDERTMYIQALLAAHGYLTGDYHRGKWYDKTIEALSDAMAASRAEREPLLPFLMSGLTKEEMQDAGITGGGGTGDDMSPQTYTDSSTSTATNTTIALSSRSTARAVLTAALESELGRKPTSKEVSMFLRSLNAREEKNPATSTSTTTSSSTSTVTPKKNGQDTVSSSTSDTTTTSKEANVDPNAMGERFAEKENPREWQKFQDAQYYGVIEQMLGM
jgi:hypothetical protein